MALACRRCARRALTAATDCCCSVVLAIALLSLLGAAGERIGYDRWLKVNTVKHRTHSLFRQGLMLYEHIPNWPTQRLRPLARRIRRHAGRTQTVQENVRRLVKI